MNNFKRLVLDNAIEQINEHSDIKAEYEQIKEGRTIVGFVFRFKAKKVIEGKSKPIERDERTADMFMGNLTDKQLARVVHSVKFMQDYGSMVSSSNSANQSSGAWISHMVEWLKKILKGLLNVQWRNIWTMSKPLSFKIFRSSFLSWRAFCHGKKTDPTTTK